MKASQIAAKVAVRLFLFLLLLALVPLFTGNSTVDTQLQSIYFMTSNKWILAFPILLILGFITLLITCTIKKYTKPDLNWLLVINTLMLIAYGITVFIRLSHLIK